jgi:tetratricopeptide (TPR) repeat protein
MALSRLKALAASPAVRKFTDRDSARGAFDKALSAYLSGADAFRVLAYYGVGGIGKTSLLTELGNLAAIRAQALGAELCTVRLDFDSDHLTSAAEAQYAFRMQWPGPCPLFEFALARYWVAQGRSLEQIQKQVIRQDSLLFDLVETSAGLADLFVPVKLVARLLSAGSDIARRYGHLRGEFDRIAALPEADLAEHLPMLLGRAIEEWAADGRRLLVLVDGHERLFTDERYKLGKLRGDDWLRELVGAAETGLYVVCGRNYVNWAEQNTEWTPYLEQHVLGRLSDGDASEFLRGIPVVEHDIRHTIVSEARGVPLYLDICASIYIIKKDAGEPVRAEDFGNVDGEVIGRFMNCLDREQAQAVRALSAVACFDRTMFVTIARALNIGLPGGLFEDFCTASYVEFLDAERCIAKVHNIIRGRLQPQVPEDDRRLIARALLDETRACRLDGDYQRMALLLRALMPVLTWPSLQLPPATWSMLTVLCLDLADAGYVDAATALGRSLAGTADGSDAAIAGAVIEAHCLRRQGRLVEAKARYAACGVARGAGGLRNLRLRVRYHAAHVDHMLGDYATAARKYRGIFESPACDDSDEDARWLARRQLGDILMLKGRFPEALQSFAECKAARNGDLLWQLECERFIGHVHRFNWNTGEALARYAQVASEAEAHGVTGMHGKALVNVAEACAWIDPGRSVEAAQRAIEITDACNNAVESGKAWTAMAIAHLGLGQLQDAASDLARAGRIQEECGYRAGQMFVRGAEACLHLAGGDRLRMQASLEAMQADCDAIGVYRHLAWFYRRVCGTGDVPAAEVATWLDAAVVESAVARVAASRQEG